MRGSKRDLLYFRLLIIARREKKSKEAIRDTVILYSDITYTSSGRVKLNAVFVQPSSVGVTLRLFENCCVFEVCARYAGQYITWNFRTGDADFLMLSLVLLGIACGAVLGQPGPKMIDETTRWSQCHTVNQSIYDFQMETLQGQFTDLSQYKGQVLLVINVATFCAYTQQYTDFNPMIEKNMNGGFTVIAFPCNQFYLQEPAENHELLNGVMYVRPGNGWKPHQNLHIYGKIDVNGDNQHPLYEFLKESCPQTVDKLGKTEELMWNPIKTSDITWNFEKFLIDRKGQPRFRFHPTAWSHGDVVQPFIDQLMNEAA